MFLTHLVFSKLRIEIIYYNEHEAFKSELVYLLYDFLYIYISNNRKNTQL